MFVVCNGMQRSGSTLQYNIARGLCERLGVPTISHGPLDANTLQSREEVRRRADDCALHIVKMHDIDPLFIEMGAACDIRFLYIYRDIRDVTVSLNNKKLASIEFIVNRLDIAMEAYKTLQEAGETIRTLWQRYEDVVPDLPTAAMEIADFLGLEAPHSVILEIADANSIHTAKMITSNLQRQIREYVRDVGEHSGRGKEVREWIRTKKLRFLDKTTLLHYDHISNTEGATGVWKTQLTLEELGVLVERYGWWLEQAGYAYREDASNPG